MFTTKKLPIVFVIALAVVGVNAAVSYRNTLKSIEAEQWVTHTHQVLTELESTLSTLNTAETSQRGYLLTGDEKELAPYQSALVRSDRQINNLRVLTADNPNQQQRITLLEQKVIDRLKLLQSVINLRRDKGFDAAQFLVISGRGRQMMGDIRQLIREMEDAENKLLQRRSQASKANSQKAIATISIATFLNVGLLILLYYLIRRDHIQRQQVAATLQKSEQRFRATFEQAAVGIAHVALDGKWLQVNQKLCDIVGYSRGELLKLTFQDVTHPDDLDTDLEYVNQLLTSQIQTYSMEKRYIKKDSSFVWISLTVSLVRQSTGEPQYFISVIEEITKRKQAQAALRESKNRLRAILDAEPECVKLVAQDGTLLEINAAGLTILGVENTNVVIGKSVYSLIAAEHKEAFQNLNQSVCQGNRGSLEFEIINGKGNRRWLETHAVPLCDAETKTCMHLAVTRDVTERKLSEQKIREQAALLDVATDAIFVQDLEAKILYWNKGAEQLYGRLTEATCGQNAYELLYEEPALGSEEPQQKLVVEGKWQGELEQVTHDGKKILVYSRWTMMRDEQGKPKSILIVNTDITEQKKLELQFLRAQRLESLGTLAGGIAHDLNNILTPILMSVQLLKTRFSDEKNQHLLSRLETTTKRGAALVKQILSFARGLEGKHTILQVKHLLREIEQIAKETFPKSIEINTNIASNIWAVSADATQIHQVLMNLVINARDAMPEGGSLSISAANQALDEQYAQMNLDAQPGDYVKISVADTGMGMPPEIIERIFDPFFTTKEVGAGTGLGLSTVIGIVKSHGGFVNVYSEVGKGTTFKVYLPAKENHQPQLVKDIELCLGEGELILIADDEVAIREIAKTTLETYNYRVLTASNGVEALALYSQHKDEIDLVLIDMMMPSMDGSATIKVLQKINSHVKIIAISGLLLNEQVAKVADHGVKAFLPKPCTAKELLQTINSVKQYDSCKMSIL